MDEIVNKLPHGEKLSDSIYQFYQPKVPVQLEVVFVHGLEHPNYGDAYWRTWLAQDGTLDNIWPMTWIPDEFSSAKVFALKYDAIIEQSATDGRMDLVLVGEMLVQEMVQFGQIGQNGVPVVFMCHGFGGLVAKQIVISAKHLFSQDLKAQKLLKNIEAFLFYSTPHHGSYFDRFWGDAKGPLYENLEVSSNEISLLNHAFEQVAKEHSWIFPSTIETQVTKLYGEMVLEEASSSHEVGNYLALSNDHFDVVRPKTKKDSSYLLLTNCLKEVLQRYMMKFATKVESLGLDGFVRLDVQGEALKKKLQEESIVGLVGIGGIGKTTLTRAVYQSVRRDFERSCYLDDVKSKASIDDVLLTLLQDFGIKDRKTGGIVERSTFEDSKKNLLEDLKTFVKQHRVLVVIDDVGTKENFACLLKGMDFLNGNKESKVIVTCRNWQVLKDHVQRSGKYEVEPMSFGQDIELFSYRAFKGARTLEERRQILLGYLSKDSSQHLVDEFESVCNDVVKACGGLPLSLEVMGGCLEGYLANVNLSSMECLDCWRGALEKLYPVEPLEGGVDNDRLWKVLQVAYDCLHENEQNMFLDIACFFCDSVRYTKETLLRIWGGKPSKLIEFRNLEKRYLVKIEEDESVTMHNLLRDMGRRIVRHQCEGVLSKMTRLWDFEDVNNLVQSNEIIALVTQGLSMEEWGITPIAIMEGRSVGTSKRLKIGKMKGFSLDCPMMRLLNLHKVEKSIIEAINIKGYPRIQWLCLKGINIFELPKFVQACNELRVLDMSDCQHLKSLDESIANLVNLLELNLSRCINLVTMRNSLGNVIKLTKLDLLDCKSLTSLPDSIGKLVNLSTLNISGCEGLTTLPDSIGKLISLSTLKTSGCKGLTSLPNSIGNLVNLSTLHISCSYILTSLPNSIGNLVNLSTLHISGCEALASLPDSIGNLVNLSTLHISNCVGLTSLPDSIGNLVNLSTLHISGCEALASLPDSIGNLVNLSTLHISGCEALASLPDSIGNLVNLSTLHISGCEALASLPDSIGNLVNLSTLHIFGCYRLTSLPDSIGNLVNLSTLHIYGCEALASLPDSIGNLVNLSTLHISDCVGLTSLPDSIGNLVNLSTLHISRCYSLTSLPDSIGNLVNLSTLHIFGCYRLTSLPDSIGNLVNLSTLHISRCYSLTSLPDSIGNLVNLSTLHISGCEALASLPDSIGNLVNLSTLHISGCEALASLPDSIGNLVNLSTLHIFGCYRLTSLPDSIGNLVNLSTLHISDCVGLTSLPDSIGKLVNLSTLHISGCYRLSSLPDSIGNLVNLSTLHIFGCEALASLPDSIGKLVNLSTLHISGCYRLTSLPDSIGNLVNLSTLHISDCVGLTSLPDSIGNLVNLSTLHISDCVGLTSLPDSIGNLVNLSTLHISDCVGLTSLPDSIGNLVNLSTLHISDCVGLTSLPDSIGKLVNLSTLHISGCYRLSSLPDSIGNLVNLSTPHISKCVGLTSLPDSIGNVINLSTFGNSNHKRLTTLLDPSSKVVNLSKLSFHNDGYSFPDELNDETIEDISKAQEADDETMEDISKVQEADDETMQDIYDVQEVDMEMLSSDHDVLSHSHDGALKLTLDDLNIITGNFSESLVVGQGGFESVYRGQLKDGTTVAVKRIKKKDTNILEIEDIKDFQIEADSLCKEKHLNLVRLLGFLEDENELILVTEYVTNGNLRQHLDGVLHRGILDMSKRCRISLDVVAALKHLHNQPKDDLDIIHRDIKSSNILITDDFRAKVAGFGLSQRSPLGDVGASSSSTPVKGTLGYMAHEHSIAHFLKEQIDVYSFGKLLFEIFTGKYLVESSLRSDECFTPKWVLKQCAKGRFMDIIDPKITPTTINLKILEQIFKLAVSCLGLEESIRPTLGDVLGDLSFILGHYFEDLKDESNSKGVKYEVQEEQKWDLEACIEPNLQAQCLEESKALRGKESIQQLDKMDSSNPSFLPTKLHGSFFVEGFQSNEVQTSTQLSKHLVVDSKQATKQAFELSVVRQEKTSPLITDIIPDMFPLKSDVTYFEMLQEEIAKLDYVSRLLNQGDDFNQNVTNIGKTSFILFFNEEDNVFEFYFKNYQGMASIVGVGLECAKVILEDGWRVTIQEISKSKWDDAWKNLDSPSAMKVTILDPLEEGMDNTEDSQASIPKGQCLLLDLAQYFILKMSISSFLPRTSMMHANNGSGTSSSSGNQDIAGSSSSSDEKVSISDQYMKNLLIAQEIVKELKIKNGNDPPKDPPNDDDVKIDTTVHLKFLPGGCLFDGNNPFDATISDDKELEELTSQLDNTIQLEMLFKFFNENDRKKIYVLVGPISFQLGENEINYQTTGRFGWYHNLLNVSFGPVNSCDSGIDANYKALNTRKGKKTTTRGSANATTHGTSNSVNGGVKGKIPHVFTLFGGGSSDWSTTKSNSDNIGLFVEEEFEATHNGFEIVPNRCSNSSTLKYSYCDPNFMHELNHGELPCEDYRKNTLSLLPICRPQEVKFEGTWLPKSSGTNPQEVAEYSLITSREVHMTSKEVYEKVVKKPWIKRKRGHPKIQMESNEPLKYIQKYDRRIFLNHAMTYLNGKKFEVEEIARQRPLNEREPETHFEVFNYTPHWQANPLVGLNSDLHYQP